ncbi:AVAST type 1 anti-phage system protein Avs1c [Flavobacterium sp. WG21]|uniref:AVAST type 1 anti-phage system protein Avs1c n=1 Tax=Flavobacterium sp. WG21 TaxID=1229487 RepID=UPI000347B6AC|nr:AVAST type 1 anti-phage system protein Avs1c [Flavobacterium sp. WG21]
MQDKFNKEFLSSRKEFERHFHLLNEMLAEGKLKFSLQSQRSIDGLQKMRRLPNCRIDFNTVNESARLTANMVSNFGSRKEINKDEK